MIRGAVLPGEILAETWLETGESYAFTADASVRAVETTLAHSIHGAASPAEAFGSDFVLEVDDTARIEQLEAFEKLTVARSPG
jgi:hypothetical protein